MADVPSRAEWAEWREHPVTRWYYEGLKSQLQDKQEQFSSGVTLREQSDDTAQATSRAVGYMEGLVAAIYARPDHPEVEA